MKTDAKIDMLHRSGLFGKSESKSPSKPKKTRPSYVSEDIKDEEEVDLSMSVVRNLFPFSIYIPVIWSM